MEKQIKEEFMDMHFEIKQESLLDKLRDLAMEYGLEPGGLCNEWVAFSNQNNSCALEMDNLEKFDGALRCKTPSYKRTASKMKGRKTFTVENLGSMFGDQDEGLIDQYATPEESEKWRHQKRSAEQTTPTTPANKMRHTQNGTTPVSSVPTNGHTPNGEHSISFSQMNSTPVGKYSQRRTSGSVVASLNDTTVPVSWRGQQRELKIEPLGENPLVGEPQQYMFQKVTEKTLALIDRIETFGHEICSYNELPEPQPLNSPEMEGAVFTGQVVCDGEGHLNARSCLLEGPVGKRPRHKGTCVHLNIPDHVQCSLFPGQIIAVEGVNSYSMEGRGHLIPSKIYDTGTPLSPPLRSSITGFTLVMAVGPFTTTDNLDCEPLKDLMEIVKRERPDLLLLCGPFVDSTHPHVKKCQLPGDMSFNDYFKDCVVKTIEACTKRTKVVMVPSQRDVHHPYSVYPQPKFSLPPSKDVDVTSYPDPSTLCINGVCVGLTSTDVLFHLSARTMFRGPVGDRMARIAKHIIQQKCYYPLLPAFRQSSTSRAKSTNQNQPSSSVDEETTEVNINFIDAFEYKRALLPVRPDLLILPSDLKPFIKVLDGCICVNPGRLTKQTTGGTFMKAVIPDIQANGKTDLTSALGVQIVHI